MPCRAPSVWGLLSEQAPQRIGDLLSVPEQAILFGVVLSCILQRRPSWMIVWAPNRRRGGRADPRDGHAAARVTCLT